MKQLNQYAPIVLIAMGLLILILGAKFIINLAALLFIAFGGYIWYMRRNNN
jgi:hypothetical protein